jgi:predicted CxxxxCH...CXXCH cytochrome family protein
MKTKPNRIVGSGLFSLIFLLFLCSYHTSYGQVVSGQPVTTTTTWTVPAGVTSVEVKCWGAGGGGSGGNIKNLGNGGGGGGAYATDVVVVIPGNQYTITVGTGGAAGTNGAGSAGGNSSFSTFVIAVGGSGGTASAGATPGSGGSGGLNTNCTPLLNAFSGGNGGNGNNASTGGGGGGSADETGNGGNGGTPTAGTAPTNGGVGGTGGTSGIGSPGTAPGGGGGGSGEKNDGGAGADGQVILTWTVSNDNCPESTSVTPSGIQTLCQGDASSLLTAAITNSGGDGTPTQLYQWYYNTTDSNDPSVATPVGTNATYSPPTTVAEDRWYFCVGYATDNNCAQTNDDQTLASNTVQVSVSATPTPAAAGSPETICDGSGATLGANSPLVGTGAWSVFSGPSANASQFSNLADPAATFTPDGGDGDYVLRWTITNSPCTPSTSDVTITVTATPTPAAAGSPETICDGSGATLGANSPLVGTGAWSVFSGPSLNTSQFSNLADPSATFTPDAGVGDYIIRWTIANGPCTPSTSDVTITVKDIPALPVISGPTTVTEGNNYTYSITPPVADATNYTWDWPGNPGAWTYVSGQGTNSLEVTAGSQGGDITVFVTNSCGDGPIATLTASIGVASNCPESTSVTPTGVQTLCVGDASSALTATVTNTGGSGTPTHLYQWYYNTSPSNSIGTATLIPGATNQAYTPLTTVSEIGDRYYFCVGYATDNGCGQTNADQALASTNTVQVTVKDVPSQPTITGATTVTAGNPETYFISPIGDATNYTWSVPGDWTDLTGQGTASITVTPQSEGDVTVYVTNSCGDGPTATKSVTFGVSATCPESTSIAPAGTQTLCQGDATSTLTATITNTTGGSGTPTHLYQWYYNTSSSNSIGTATLIVGATNQTYIPLTSASEVGDRWYFCVGYATDNGCAQTNSDQTLASNTVQVTVNALPTAAAITGSSEVCIGSNITLTEGTAGTIVWYSSNTGVATINSSGLVTPVTTGTTNITYDVTDGNGCTSALSPIHEVTVLDIPVTPTISGTSSVPPFATGYEYSITEDPTATLYSWSFPANWVITDGANSNIITVTTGDIGDNGNVTVTVTNSCGTSGQATLAVTVDPATDHTDYNCTSCHITHSAPGSTLTNVLGNALLCQSCHITNGAASNKPLVDGNKATPGFSGQSHAWNVDGFNETYETNLPTNNEMPLRMPEDPPVTGPKQLICSTCHNQHNDGNAGFPYLRMDNTDDAMCKDCHSVRDVGLYTSNPTLNRGSHPVGVVYDDTDTRFNNTQTLITNGNNVQCSTCHGVHDIQTPSTENLTNDGYLLRMTNDVNLCADCHNYGSHNGTTCLDCHEVHNTVDGTIDDNIYMIKGAIETPISGNMPVIFTARGGNTGSYAGTVDGEYTGICEVCHDPSYNIAHFNNDGNGSDQLHTSQPGNIPEANCTSCHPHSSNFSPSGGDCVSCHQTNFPTWNVSDGHVAHTTKYNFDCSTCHFERGSGTAFHENGTADINFNPNGMATRNGQDTNIPTFNGNNCDNIYCHSDGQTARRSSDANFTWSGFTPINLNPTYLITPNWDLGSITDCNLCHPGPTSGGVSGPVTGNMNPDYLIGPPPGDVTARPNTGTHNSGNHSDNDKGLASTNWNGTQCFWCHKADASIETTPGTIDATTQQYQGTYGIGFDGTGTILHVDGETQFDPRQYSNGGTFPDNNTYAADAAAPHCGNPKSCW